MVYTMSYGKGKSKKGAKLRLGSWKEPVNPSLITGGRNLKEGYYNTSSQLSGYLAEVHLLNEVCAAYK